MKARWTRHHWTARVVTLDTGAVVPCRCAWWRRIFYLGVRR